MARPEGALSQLVAVRVSAETAQAWRAAAQRQGVGLSDLIRARMAEPGQEPERTGRPTPARGPGRGSAPKADPKLVAELARLGNNLNQLARRANTAKAVDLAVLATLQGIAEQLDATLAQVALGRGSASDEEVSGGLESGDGGPVSVRYLSASEMILNDSGPATGA